MRGGRSKMKVKPDYVIDFRESIAPLALLKMGMLAKQMKPHERLEIIVKDPDIRSDVLRIVPGCKLVDMEFNNEEDFCRIQLQKSESFDIVSLPDAAKPNFS
jgi:TusA-related sulfurtransferase